ncbi:hypothetical protein L1049_011126 [Liquidambar formosana]|uniref:Uncharacterized protein n=1 Tax=Liquidambar formosana TaxID=63359 RepID=A0AAP0RW66_LIQFO
MSNSLLFMALFSLFLLLTPPALTTGPSSISRVAAATRPLESRHEENYVNLNPRSNHGQHGFRSGDVKSCLPKGLRHSSAPSRYGNYNTLGSTVCSSDGHGSATP